MSNPRPLDKLDRLKPCKHNVKGLCCACEYGERSWQKSKKGMIAERDCVDFIKLNKNFGAEDERN